MRSSIKAFLGGAAVALGWTLLKGTYDRVKEYNDFPDPKLYPIGSDYVAFMKAHPEQGLFRVGKDSDDAQRPERLEQFGIFQLSDAKNGVAKGGYPINWFHLVDGSSGGVTTAIGTTSLDIPGVTDG